MSVNTYYHCALIGNGGADGARTIKLYINGTQEGSTYTYNYNFKKYEIALGANQSSYGECLYGWIDEFRISKGIERWTSNFTPPTSPYNVVKKVAKIFNI